MSFDPESVKHLDRPHGLPFRIGKLGHVVLNVADLERSVRFYTEVLGFRISDVYPENMMPGGMVFMRCNADHHGVALVGSMRTPSSNLELNHLAFEVATLDEVLRARDHLRRHGVPIDFAGRRRGRRMEGGAQSRRGNRRSGARPGHDADRSIAHQTIAKASTRPLSACVESITGRPYVGVIVRFSPGR
jgi:catechol 2,3-dioxygenase-like lactoylglutathione lyase family enzyme